MVSIVWVKEIFNIVIVDFSIPNFFLLLVGLNRHLIFWVDSTIWEKLLIVVWYLFWRLLEIQHSCNIIVFRQLRLGATVSFPCSCVSFLTLWRKWIELLVMRPLNLLFLKQNYLHYDGDLVPIVMDMSLKILLFFLFQAFSMVVC